MPNSYILTPPCERREGFFVTGYTGG
jgi:hypothetical protein